jgi:hypothetical protein
VSEREAREAAAYLAALRGERGDSQPDNGTAPTGGREPFHLLTREEIWKVPEPTWVVDGLIQTGTLVELFGISGSFKSFEAMALACGVATNTPWLGHRIVTAGPVIYVGAENPPGLAKRFRAWEHFHKVEAEWFRLLGRAVQMLNAAEVLRFAESVARQLQCTPVACMLDTVSRMIPGVSENATEVMSQFVANVDLLRREAPELALVAVHHTGYEGSHSRGSSSLPFAADTWLHAERLRGESTATLTLTKQRDGEDGKRLGVKLVLVPEQHSAVVIATDERMAEPLKAPKIRAKPRGHRYALRALIELKRASYAAWRMKTGLVPSTFGDALAALSSAHLVEQLPNGDWQPTVEGGRQAALNPQWFV